MKTEVLTKSGRASRTVKAVICVIMQLVFTQFFASFAMGQNNTQSAISSTAADPSYYHTSTLMADGRVLMVAGGGKSTVVSSAVIYDPVSQTLTVQGVPIGS